jgi:hypothetical protein
MPETIVRCRADSYHRATDPGGYEHTRSNHQLPVPLAPL